MSQELPVNTFEWIEDTSQFNEYFIKNSNEESNGGYFLEVDLQCIENYINLSVTQYYFKYIFKNMIRLMIILQF